MVKEILRYRPPAPMVIQQTQCDYRLTDDYVVPKGGVIVPSISAACQQVSSLLQYLVPVAYLSSVSLVASRRPSVAALACCDSPLPACNLHFLAASCRPHSSHPSTIHPLGANPKNARNFV